MSTSWATTPHHVVACFTEESGSGKVALTFNSCNYTDCFFTVFELILKYLNKDTSSLSKSCLYSLGHQFRTSIGKIYHLAPEWNARSDGTNNESIHKNSGCGIS